MGLRRGYSIWGSAIALSSLLGISGVRNTPPLPANTKASVTIFSETENTGESREEFIDIRLKWGATLETLLRSQAVSTEQATALVQALRQVFDPRRLRAGDNVRLRHDQNGDLAELRYQPSPEYNVIVVRDSLGNYNGRVDSLEIRTESALVVGKIETTLYDAVLKQGESPELIVAFSDIFQWDIDFFTEPRVGDRFYILFEKNFVWDDATKTRHFIRYGDICAGAYAKSDTTLIAYALPDSLGNLRYYDGDGNSFQKTFLKSPLNYRRISSMFNSGRRHPLLKRIRAHTGVDFAAPTGTPVVASADGTVTILGWQGGYGKCVQISHKNGSFVTLYGHLSGYAKNLTVGSRVQQGQIIGYVGATGLATGPHLHYTMFSNGTPIDPLKIRPSAGEPINPNDLGDFFTKRDVLQLRLGLADRPEFFANMRPAEGIAR